MSEPEDEMDGAEDHPAVRTWLRPLGLIAFIAGTIAAANLAVRDMLGAWLILATLMALTGAFVLAWGIRQEALAGRTRLTTPERARLLYDQFNGFWVAGFSVSFVVGQVYITRTENAFLQALLVIIPLLLLAATALQFAHMVIRSDEHQRAQHLLATAISGGVLVVLMAGWSTIATLAGGLSEPPGWALLPAFAVIYALVQMSRGRDEA